MLVLNSHLQHWLLLVICHFLLYPVQFASRQRLLVSEVEYESMCFVSDLLECIQHMLDIRKEFSIMSIMSQYVIQHALSDSF